MSKTFILINSTTRTVSEYISGDDTLTYMQKAVGGYIEAAFSPNEKNDIFVDEEGLLKGYDDFFTYDGAHQPFAGNGIVTGVNDDGDTISTSLTLEEVTKKVKFYTRQDLRQLF